MTVLPSPIPHPLDLAPWDVPGWIYEALDWVVGVQWPEGDERAVWDVADKWYDVAAVIAGPHLDAAAAAVEVRNGYGGVGAVDAAFEAAWRGIAENPDAPLPVLLAVTADLGRLVEECGCDIEGAKLEVWIELGILVIELLSVAVAAVLTAGAATPAAGAAITATRLLVQQIFKRLMGQLASKSLKHGLREAGERAAKEVARGGVRGFAKRAAREGLEEAAEESGVTLATQAYQNSTGRAHGLDLTDLGASAVGGLAGGAVAPLAGLGRHATGRAARVGEHLGREMTGEVLADSAASLATGQGLTSMEDVARAAASGATGSVTGQTDHALRARLDAQADALAGASLAGPALPSVAALAGDTSVSGATFAASAPAVAGSPGAGASPVVPTQATAPDQVAPFRADLPPAVDAHMPVPQSVDVSPDMDGIDHPLRPPDPMPTATTPLQTDTIAAQPVAAVQPLPPVAADPSSSLVDAARTLPPMPGADPTASSLHAGRMPPVVGDPTLTPIAADPALSSVTADPALSSVAADPRLSSVAAPVVGTAEPASGPVTGTAPGQPGNLAHPAGPTAWPPSTGLPAPATAGPTPPAASVAPPVGAPPTVVGRSTVPSRAPARGVRSPAPEHPARGRASIPVDLVFGDPVEPAHETDDSYAAQWAAEAEAAERRRYQGHYESQRTGFETNRRRAETARLRARAAEHDRRAIEYATYARQLHQAGHRQWSDGWQRAANDEARAYAHWRDLADAVLVGATAPQVVDISAATFEHANRDVGALALGAVETSGPSRLTGDDGPPPIDDSRPYGQPGGLRPPLALHQVDVERQMPREPDGTVTRTADPRRGGWFRLLNDGGPAADATRGINCLDCTMSLFETWVHGRPRVSAPRTFDGYLDGDIRRPIRGEAGGPGRVEDVTGGRFQQLLAPSGQRTYAEQARPAADRGYRNLQDQLLLGGHGSYAFLVTEWAHGGSHAWVALNQNGTVLYVDPQTGMVRDRPLYPDVVGIDALVLGGDGRPMPLGGLPRGRFSERPDLPDHPPTRGDGGHGDPYVNRMYLLLDGPGSAQHPVAPDDGVDEASGSHPPDVELAQLTAAELAGLTALRDRAAAVADQVEAALVQVGRNVSEAMGLPEPIQLRDRASRVKKLNSLARKFLDEARGAAIGVEQFASTVNDALRFLFEMPPSDGYRVAVDLVIAGLVEAGFSVPQAELKNFWRAGNRFYGFNCTLRSPGGLLVELQLHTRDSREAWMRTHVDYEILRRVGSRPEDHVHAFLRMLAANRERRMSESVPPGLADRYPTKDASFAKWLSRNGDAWRKYQSWLDSQGANFSQIAQELGLDFSDFPVAEDVAAKLEKEIVDVLRNLSK
ncbi:toxin glutamine deamidase domain-containing protein [Micromonospora sp. WMMD961]|uniref:toxin glutamine deamidase domain-containing protein n=1 Tax=Micromonospora sp. WMMD961 TaxID=3016100 RepID=UPI002417EB33|nr:toxin glutamine deamidase domain-containing protein [Micromonospora sp. WMMD961]MDG4779316.1 toxin glutamine deamidase domain-containing protein [Micromonospora sp. WMMD961]